MRTAIVSVVCMGLLTVAGSPALAQLSGSTSSTTGATCSGGNSGDGDCRNSTQVLINNGTTFQSRYAWNINADTGVLSTHDTNGTAQHNLSFTATAVGGYRLDISTSRVGALGRSADASNCDGSADTSGVTGNSNVTVASGTLSLADPGVISNGGGDANTPFNQSSGTAQIFRFSGGVGQTHSLSFTWNGSVRSNSCEASVRQGESSGTTSGCAICGYPGNPSRTQSSDGHFVTVTFTSLCGNGTVESAAGEDCDLGASNGSSTSCCTSQCKFRAAGQQCRASAGTCDVAETCTGSAANCPVDGFASSSTTCRPSAGVCDPAENCPGNGPNCPADVRSPSGTACPSDGNPCTLDQCDGTNAACQHPAGNAGVTCRAGSGDVCDPAEVCDGTSTSCPPDVVLPNTFECRPAAGECDIAETCGGLPGQPCPADAKKPNGSLCTDDGNPCSLDQCNGTSDTCPHPPGNAGAVCRAAAGPCDLDENCTGSSTTCPPDALQPSTVVCRGSAGPCDLAENCTGTSPDCPADAKSTAECRPSAGVCDPAESCDGVNDACPADAKSTAECRPVAGPCDVAESCDGVNNDCPGDLFEPSSTVCRPSAGVCDPAENCPGTAAACPADAKSTAECRPSAGPCDIPEDCDGVNDDCPPDSVQSPGGAFVCRPAAGPCDLTETCDGTGAACPADAFQPSTVVCRPAAGPCDLADMCTGSDANCPADAKSTAVCRPAAGPCDAAESCDGASDSCPADAKSIAACRPAAGPCDVTESCDGIANTCPADAKSTAVCRPAAGPCDVADSCDGVNNACPADAKSTAVCRAATGTCDQAESCDGVSNTCPADQLKPSGTVCRPAASSCDFAETCTGTSATCPTDVTQPDGTPCNDNSACTTGDACQGGLCVGTPNLDGCVDDFLCYKAKASTPFTQIPSVHLVDQFEDVNVSVLKPRHLCTPANKNNEGILDAATHLRSYRIKSLSVHLRRVGVKVTNQLGQLFVDTIRPDLLLVPSAKSLTGPPPAPSNGSHNVDHFKCYKVRVTAGTPKLAKGIQVSVADQFTSPAKIFDVRKPRHLCTPVNKNSEGIKNPDAHLLCYLVKRASGQPKHQRRSPVYVNNQFGPGVVATVKEDELCIPSVKTP